MRAPLSKSLRILWSFGLLAPAARAANATARVIWELPGDAWLECITQRSNGDLLITRYDTGEIWTVNPATNNISLVHQFPPDLNVNSSLGIVEYQDDVFAFTGGQTAPPDRSSIGGTWSIWSIDLRGWTPDSDSTPTVNRLRAIPDAGLLNGLTVLYPATTTGPRANGEDAPSRLLAADSILGTIWEVSPSAANESVGVFYTNPGLLTPPKNATFPVGVNGLQVPPVADPAFLYFSGGARGTFYKLAVSNGSVVSGAEPELLTEGFSDLDDFSLEADGTAYLSTGFGDEIVKLTPEGVQTVIYSGDLVESSTSTWLTEIEGEKVLYVNTGRPPGYTSQPGRLVELVLNQTCN